MFAGLYSFLDTPEENLPPHLFWFQGPFPPSSKSARAGGVLLPCIPPPPLFPPSSTFKDPCDHIGFTRIILLHQGHPNGDLNSSLPHNGHILGSRGQAASVPGGVVILPTQRGEFSLSLAYFS